MHPKFLEIEGQPFDHRSLNCDAQSWIFLVKFPIFFREMKRCRFSKNPDCERIRVRTGNLKVELESQQNVV